METDADADADAEVEEEEEEEEVVLLGGKAGTGFVSMVIFIINIIIHML